MFYDINKLKEMKSMNIKIGSARYGMTYGVFFRALEIAKKEHKVSLIATKNKKQFNSVIKEITNNSGYNLKVETFKDRFDIIENNILLVQIIEF